MKAKVFVFMTKFLQENGQLESVMIAQVRDVINLSANWNLTNDERMNLYTECAKSLDLDGDSQGAFAIYFESLLDINAKNASKYQSQATALLTNAVKGP